MIYDHFAHIIRDLFPGRENVIYYGEDINFLETFHKPEHCIGAYLVHSNPEDNWSLSGEKRKLKNVDPDMCKGWAIEFNDAFFGHDFCDLLFSVNYEPWMLHQNFDFVAENIKKLMNKNGIVFVINPGNWATSLNKFFTLREDLITEAKRFSLIKNETVLIYENI